MLMASPGRQALSIWIGFDMREAVAFAVAKESIRQHLNRPVPVYGLVLDELRGVGLYTRPTERRGGQLWDVISDAPMSTEFACSRFLVPHLAGGGWALFQDCDMLARANYGELFSFAERPENAKYAVLCVKHQHEPMNTTKMDGQKQTRYARKNWSSFMLFNCNHPSNAALTPEFVNAVAGRDLHGFCWLKDEEIGTLDVKWNWLVGHSDPHVDPANVHFTDGIPAMPGYENCAFADEWQAQLSRWASSGATFTIERRALAGQ